MYIDEVINLIGKHLFYICEGENFLYKKNELFSCLSLLL